jgi:hypothetical protein
MILIAQTQIAMVGLMFMQEKEKQTMLPSLRKLFKE